LPLTLDNVNVTEMYESRVAKFTSDGMLIQRWDTGPISRGIAVDSRDNIYVTSANIGDTNYLVQKFSSDGVLLDQWSSAMLQTDFMINAYYESVVVHT
jgi:hypothetical protein